MISLIPDSDQGTVSTYGTNLSCDDVGENANYNPTTLEANLSGGEYDLLDSESGDVTYLVDGDSYTITDPGGDSHSLVSTLCMDSNGNMNMPCLKDPNDSSDEGGLLLNDNGNYIFCDNKSGEDHHDGDNNNQGGDNNNQGGDDNNQGGDDNKQ